MLLPEVSDAGPEAIALDEAEVAAEHGLGAPVLLSRVTPRRRLEPLKCSLKFHFIISVLGATTLSKPTLCLT